MSGRHIAAFIRHADYHQLPNTPSALQPFALTEKGRGQCLQAAAEMADFITKHNWQLTPTIASSSSLRAWQTAQIYSEQLSHITKQPIKIASSDQLTERSVGAVANLTIEQIERVIEQDPRCKPLPTNWKSNSHFKLPFNGAESLIEAGQRVAQHITDTMRSLPLAEHDCITLFIGHGASFRHAAYVLEILNISQIAALSMYHAHPLYIEYANGAWHHIAGEWKVRSQQTEFID